MHLLEMPEEVVVLVASLLDLPSTLALASSSSPLLHILTRRGEWRALLRKSRLSAGGSTKEVVEEVQMLTTFLQRVECSEELVQEVLCTICHHLHPVERGEQEGEVRVGCREHGEHLISLLGLHLVVEVEKVFPTTLIPLVGVEVEWMEEALLSSLLTKLSHQEELLARLQVPLTAQEGTMSVSFRLNNL